MPPPRPPVAIEVGRTVGVLPLRLVVAAMFVAGATASASAPTAWLAAVLAVSVVTLSLARPSAVWPALLAGLLGVGLLLGTVGPIRTAIVILAGHAIVALGGVVGMLPWSARVELRVLRRPLLRFVAIQAFAQSLAAAGLWVGSSGNTFGALAVGAAIIVAVAVWRLATRLQAASRSARWNGPGRS
jgi:hypothetical protein